jgi:PAS domain S-box-containing protein
VAQVAGTSRGVPALAVLLAFTALAIIVVVHYGRHSVQLTLAYHDLHRATLQRERSEAALRESERFVRATLDAMDAMIAVLDADGVVMAVNRAWRSCMDDLVGRDGACDVGANYVSLCESVADGRSEVAGRVAAGLREAMAGTRTTFEVESPIADDRRLVTHVSRFPGHGPLRLVVAHQYVTAVAPPARTVDDIDQPAGDDRTVDIAAPPPSPDPAHARDDEHFRALAEAVPVGVFLADGAARNTYTNPKWHEITGMPADRGLGSTWADAVHADDRDRVLDAWRALCDAPGVFDAEFRLRRPSGEVRWVHVLAKPLAGGAWGPGGFVGSMLDVTERRAVEEGMRSLTADLADRVEARTRERDRFFTLSLDMLCVANATHFTMVNPAFTDVLGYAAEELLALPYLELVHPDDREATRISAERLGGGDPVVQFENRYRHRDGTWRWISWTAVPETPDVVYATGRDVTDRKRVGQELERVAGELRDLYDNAPCGYHSLDGGGVFVAVNDTELAWLGYARDELVGRRRFADLLAPASRPRFEEGFERLKAHGRVAELELDVVRKDGTVLPVLLSATVVQDADGRFVSRASLFDVAERRRAAERVAALNEALASRAVELEKANRELESFSYSLSHDLRAPLRAIDGFARILHDERGDELGAGGKRHLGIIRENAGRMAQLIDGLLDLSRIARRPLVRAPVDMASLAHAVVADVRRAQPDRDIAVDVGELAPAVGDPAQLRQVVTNLVTNAFKYTGKVGHPCVDVGSVDHDGTTVYYVRDNGAGFDMRYADKLFQVFQRLHTPEEFDGTGIGLAVVQRVIGRHGGRVWAEGRVGEGATFFFTLGDRPAAEADVSPSA